MAHSKQVLLGVINCIGEQLTGNPRSIVFKDSEGCHSQTTIANTIPVTGYVD